MARESLPHPRIVLFFGEIIPCPQADLKAWHAEIGRTLLDRQFLLGVTFNETESDCLSRGDISEANMTLSRELGVSLFSLPPNNRYPQGGLVVAHSETITTTQIPVAEDFPAPQDRLGVVLMVLLLSPALDNPHWIMERLIV